MAGKEGFDEGDTQSPRLGCRSQTGAFVLRVEHGKSTARTNCRVE